MIALFHNGEETLVSDKLTTLVKLIVERRRLRATHLARLIAGSNEAAELLIELHNLGALEPQYS